MDTLPGICSRGQPNSRASILDLKVYFKRFALSKIDGVATKTKLKFGTQTLKFPDCPGLVHLISEEKKWDSFSRVHW